MDTRGEQIALLWLDRSKRRALLIAVFNFAVRAMEFIMQMSFIVHEDGIERFIDQSWEFLATFFVLRIVPMLLGLLLVCAVIANHRGGCVWWCLGEMFVILSYLSLIWFWRTERTKMLGVWDTDFMICVYCIIRVVSIVVVFDFIEHLRLQDEQNENVANILLRNHFWHQLSLHQLQKEILKAVKEDEKKSSAESTEDTDKK